MAELQQRLQAAVGGSYRIEKELGGGGMSRVFLAEDVELGRQVVVKVLPPEMAAGVSVERFRREIQLAAKLQHPHIVPLLSAGSADDLLYYMMPFIEGESLRAKLAREGELPIGEAVRILKEVVDALAYAHEHNVVHRDIKPDNVLLSGKHAVVTDFGVAKAVTASTGETNLTSLGVALGTPAYMAPEQAVADPHVDHRADIYAVGAMAYEMLTGRPPFSGPNPQAVLSAHVTDPPEPATKYRTTVPEALNALVMRCLEKKAADRWQKAEELLPHLDAILTPTGGITPTGTAPVPAVNYEALARQAHPVRVAALFGVGAAVVLGVVYLLMLQLGLPDWVFAGAVILLAIGLPIALATGHHERQRALTRAAGQAVTTPSAGLRHWFTWRRSLLGGGLAFAGLGVAATIYMAMRLLGIGPVGTLIATGALEQGSRFILTEVVNRTADSTLGPSMTEALRVDLSQSPVIRLMDQASVGDALMRMGRRPNTEVDQPLAMEIAEREGAEAIVAGEIGPLGGGYVLSARLLSAEDGAELLSERVTAKEDAELIDAIDALSAKLRERIGESLKSLRARPELARVSTGSMEALRKYTEHLRADRDGNFRRAVALLHEAVAIDTAFAMAYRRLAVLYGNSGAPRSLVVETARNAFNFRDRLTERERLHVTAAYQMSVGDQLAANETYRTLLQRWPTDNTALNNLAVGLQATREYQEAEQYALQAVETGGLAVNYVNLIFALVGQGQLVRAESTSTAFEATHGPNDLRALLSRAALAAARRDYERVETVVQSLARNPEAPAFIFFGLVASSGVQGKLALADRYLAPMLAGSGDRGDFLLGAALFPAMIDVWYRDSPSDGVRKVEAALERHPLEALHPLDRPYLPLAEFYAAAGRPDRARELLAELDRELADMEPTLRDGTEFEPSRGAVEGMVALAESRADEAIAAFRAWNDDVGCEVCGWFWLGRAYETAGEPDSALAAYERAISVPGTLARLGEEMFTLGPAYKRLGELYERRGDRERAIDYYNRFVELWSEADPELQPQVRDVRGRLARLVGER